MAGKYAQEMKEKNMKLQQCIADYTLAAIAIAAGVGFVMGWLISGTAIFEQNWRVIVPIIVSAFVVLIGLNYQRIKHLETQYQEYAHKIVEVRSHLNFYVNGGCFDRKYEFSNAFKEFKENLSAILPVAEYRAGPRLMDDAVPFATTNGYVDAAANGAASMRDRAWRLFKWSDDCVMQGKFAKYRKRYDIRPKDRWDNK